MTMALDETVPSVDLVRALVGFDAGGADLDDLTAAIVGWERIVSWATACQNEVLAEADRVITSPEFGGRFSDAVRWYPDHLGLIVNLSGGSVSHRIAQAAQLVRDLPNVHAALRCGAITRRHAETAARSTRVLDTEVAQAVDAAVMVDDSWRTPSQLETVLARTILELDAAGAAARNQAARKERDVRTRNEPDGMMSLYAHLPAEQGQAVAKTIDAHARSSKACNTPGDLRTLAHRRADGLVELVLRGTTSDDGAGSGSDATTGTDIATRTGAGVKREPRLHGRRPEIFVMVSMSTVMGCDDAPAYLEGYGWIDAAAARRLAADPDSVWRRLVVDPISGRLLDFGRDTYRPPQDMTDHVIARDLTCTFPTCDLPAVLCDLDHLDAWNDGGITAADKNAPACRRHHRLREVGWAHDFDPDTGDSIWIEPTGTQHVKPAARLPAPPPVEPPDLDDPPPF